MNAPAGREGLAEGLNLHENRLRTSGEAVKRSLSGMAGGVMIVMRPQATLTHILRSGPSPVLAFVGPVPMPIEARRGRSAGFDAVAGLRVG
jgi:hypothetical protein